MAKNYNKNANYKQGQQSRGKKPNYFKNDVGNGKDQVKKGRESSQNVEMTKLISNDPAYYNKYPVDYDLATRFPWYNIIGNEIDFSDTFQFNEDGTSTWYKSALPGIMRFDFIPGIGATKDITDAVNRAYAQMMAALYAKTSGSSLGFQAADLANIQICLSSVAMLIAHARRALMSTEFWIAKNKYYPRALIKSMGFDWDDLTENKANYVFKLNSLIHQFNSIKVPKFLDVFNRQFALAHNIYVDEDSQYGQIYYFNPLGYLAYDDEGVANCKFRILDDYAFIREDTNRFRTFNYFGEFLNVISETLNALYNSSDLYLINGAVLRCYPDMPTVTISDLNINDIINPVTDRFINLQIMNMDIVPAFNLDRESLNITQDVLNNTVVWRPHSQGWDEGKDPYLLHLSERKFLRSFASDVSADDNCEMTRFTALADIASDGNGKHFYEIYSCGTEIIGRVLTFSINKENSENVDVRAAISSNIDLLTNPSNYAGLSTFRYIPFLPFAQGINDVVPAGDLYNYTIVDAKTIKSVNDMAMLSLWKVDI